MGDISNEVPKNETFSSLFLEKKPSFTGPSMSHFNFEINSDTYPINIICVKGIVPMHVSRGSRFIPENVYNGTVNTQNGKKIHKQLSHRDNCPERPFTEASSESRRSIPEKKKSICVHCFVNI
jgi:hypothetical protein